MVLPIKTPNKEGTAMTDTVQTESREKIELEIPDVTIA